VIGDYVTLLEEVLSEAIIKLPIDMEKYFRVRKKNLNNLAKECETALKVFKEKYTEEYMDDFVSGGYDDVQYLYELVYTGSRGLKGYLEMMNMFVFSPGLTPMERVTAGAKYSENFHKDLNEIDESMYLNDVRVQEYDKLSPSDIKFLAKEATEDKYGTLKQMIAVITAIVNSATILDRIKKEVGLLTEKYKEMEKMYSADTFGGEYMPDSDDYEDLYHATMNLQDLKKKGFRKDFKQTGGIGGGRDIGKPALSFTTDLYYAHSIARAFKELVMIAKGQLKRAEIMRWLDKEKLTDDVMRTFYGQVGQKSGEKDTPENTFKIYQIYLAFSKLRENPAFFSDDKKLLAYAKKLNLKKDVGILKVNVNVKHPNTQFLPAEREYRVPVEAVGKIVKIIK